MTRSAEQKGLVSTSKSVSSYGRQVTHEENTIDQILGNIEKSPGMPVENPDPSVSSDASYTFRKRIEERIFK